MRQITPIDHVGHIARIMPVKAVGLVSTPRSTLKGFQHLISGIAVAALMGIGADYGIGPAQAAPVAVPVPPPAAASTPTDAPLNAPEGGSAGEPFTPQASVSESAPAGDAPNAAPSADSSDAAHAPAAGQAIGPDPGKGFVRLPGHVLGALAGAEQIQGPDPALHGAHWSADRLTVTLVLRRADEPGFQRYLADVQDPHSLSYRKFLSQAQLTARFGPSLKHYRRIESYLRTQGFTIVAGSGNRMTITARANRRAVERAFDLHISDYEIQGTHFYATAMDPALPRSLAAQVQAIEGLSTLGVPHSAVENLAAVCKYISSLLDLAEGAAVVNFLATMPGLELAGVLTGVAAVPAELGAVVGIGVSIVSCYIIENWAQWAEKHPNPADPRLPPILRGFGNPYSYPVIGPILPRKTKAASAEPRVQASSSSSATTIQYPDGYGQTVGLLEFDTFNISDVANLLNYISSLGGYAGNIANLSTKAVNGGVPTPGSGEAEVLLDIDTVMGIAPGAKVVVYSAPFSGQATAYTALFNAMINDGVTVISNSWASCEDQVSLADAQAIDSVLQTAAASGISVFNGAGDSGSTCLDGSPNTVAVPADSPNATAVGGTSLTFGQNLMYGSESWWNGSASTPQTGQGGFGVSKYFSAPSYQAGVSSSAMRSVPDVVSAADPAAGGLQICQADNGGCPSGKIYGGTSLATPSWAAYTALLNEGEGTTNGLLNSQLYPLANTAAFHNASSMGSDFAHVGLGSPDLNSLDRLLTGATVGAPDANWSTVEWLTNLNTISSSNSMLGIPADGSSPGGVLVTLRDSTGLLVSGKAVTLGSSSSSASISPAGALTTNVDGAAVFTVTDTVPETVTLTPTDTSDGLTLTATTLTFVVPSAAGGGISASLSTAPADGQTASTITVTLKNGQGQPTPGKTVNLSDGGAHAVITQQTSGAGSASGVTDANGQIMFAATDAVAEAATFSAVDVSDGNLPVPGTATVTYSGSTQTACGLGTPPVAAAGYSIKPFITGFPAAVSFPFGGLDFGCEGVQRPAFPSSGGVLVTDGLNGSLYDLPLTGGVASSANTLAQLTPGLSNLVFGTDGSLYASIATTATAGSAVGSGSIVQLDPVTGTIKSTIASGLTCPYGLAIDPLSGDLFFDDSCSGGGTDDPTVYRVIDPNNSNAARPTSVVPYATLPNTPNGGMAFAPNGTLYVVSGYGVFTSGNGIVQQVSGTNVASVTVTALTAINSELGVSIGATNADGSAQSLIVEPAGSPSASLTEVPIANPAAATMLASTVPPGLGAVGPDGCLYLGGYDTVYRIANSAGSCAFATSNPAPALTLTPATVSPNPAQGSSQIFTATVKNVSPLSGVPLLFTVSGTNLRSAQGVTDASGNATFTYTGRLTGTDRVVASATVSGTPLASNVTQVTWAAGTHVTFLTLNTSPQGGITGQPVSVVASLADVSAKPPAALAGQTISFSLGGSTCNAQTGANGSATCQLTPSQVGTSTLTASFGGSSAYVASTESVAFHVTAAISTNPPPSVTIGVAPTSVTVRTAAQLTWSSTNATSCVASNAWNGTEATSGTQSVSPATPGTYTYVLTCTGTSGAMTTAQAVLVVVAAPSVTIGVAPPSVTVGTAAQLTWSSANATSCVASNAWSGPRATSGTLSVNPATPGTYTYVLTCTNTLGASASAQAVLVVKPVTTAAVITWPTPAPITYGTALGATQLDAKANVAGTFSYSPAAGTVLPAGVHTLSVWFTPASSAYTPAKASVQLSVQQATPYILWLPLPIFQGTPLGPFQLDAIAFEPGKFCRLLPGKFVYTPAAGKVLPAGKQMLLATFTPDDVNFKTVTVHATLEVWPSRPW